jgi:hypothetical protein
VQKRRGRGIFPAAVALGIDDGLPEHLGLRRAQRGEDLLLIALETRLAWHDRDELPATFTPTAFQKMIGTPGQLRADKLSSIGSSGARALRRAGTLTRVLA